MSQNEREIFPNTSEGAQVMTSRGKGNVNYIKNQNTNLALQPSKSWVQQYLDFRKQLVLPFQCSVATDSENHHSLWPCTKGYVRFSSTHKQKYWVFSLSTFFLDTVSSHVFH